MTRMTMHPLFMDSILYILGLCAEEKMIRSHTWWIITVVADTDLFWYGTILNNPGYPMGQKIASSGCLTGTYDSVTVVPMCSCPYPTPISIDNSPPEPC